MNNSAQSAWFRSAHCARGILALGVVLGMVPSVMHATPSCVGDCNADHRVIVNELILCVNIALEAQLLSNCMAGDDNMNGKVSVNEIIKGVNNALSSCATCGDIAIEGSEDCDDGGTCIGGPDAGRHCSSDGDCNGTGVCIGGPQAEYPCADDTACPRGRCVHCVPQGGDQCAANCTSESDVTFTLKPGELLDTTTCKPDTSCAIVHGDALTVGLLFTGMQTLTFGKERDGLIPVIVKAESVVLPRVDVGGLACACVRGVAARTCGGTAFQADGSLSPDCTPIFTAGDSVCTGKDPCAFVHGPGNSATGVLGCAGLDGTDFTFVQDGSTRPPGPPTFISAGRGGPGSGIILNSAAIGTVMGSCAAHPTFCTPADPASQRGMVTTLPLTTGTAAGLFKNANGIEDNTICDCPEGVPSCPLDSCLGPLRVSGAPLSCTALLAGSVSGATLGAFTAPGVPVVGDAVVTNTLVAQ